MTRRLLLALVAAAALTPAAAKASAPNTYRNPVITGMNPDPSIVRVGSDYFLVTSSFEYFPSCPIYHSLDLIHWQRIGYALSDSAQFAALHDEHPSTYACTLRYHDGTFYAITTDVRGGGNFLVTATNPAGPWSLPHTIDHGMFDPSLFFDDDGKVYYTRRGPGHGDGIVQALIDPSTGKLLSPLRTISNGMITDDAEGPHLYKINGWYYLSLAEGGSRFLHMQTIGRSHSPWGPFTPSPTNPWAAQHTSWDYPVRTIGHCDLVDTPSHDWWAVCLGTRHFNYAHFSLGRETFLFHVDWSNGWPSIAPQDTHALIVDRQPPGDHPFPAPPERDDFASPALSLPWNTLGPAGMRELSLTERPGFLRLHPQPGSISFASAAAFVGRRQDQWWTRSTASLDFAPASNGDRAGLTVFMSPRFHYDIAVIFRDGRLYVQLLKQVDDIRSVAAEAPIASGKLEFRIESTPKPTFFYSIDGASWKTLGSGDQRLIASEVANVWSGAYIAMFAEGGSELHSRPADFDWFDYRSSIAPFPTQ